MAAGGKVFVAAAGRPHASTPWTWTAARCSGSSRRAAGSTRRPRSTEGLVLFGSADGRVYCLRASDGQLVWRFLAAPVDRRVGYFDQIESAWPVHGSVLVDDGVAYFTAGRSTYLDGGIRVYGLDPATGKILHKGLLEGPHRDVDGERDLAFFILGANSDVLVSEGGFLYMRQKKMTPELEEVEVDVLSSKGAQDVGLHVFSTAGLLDDSWYNRTFWMYSKRWPGFQLANQAPKTGQLLVVDDEKTYAVRVFYRRNVHSPMFFPGKEGYLLFADENTQRAADRRRGRARASRVRVAAAVRLSPAEAATGCGRWKRGLRAGQDDRLHAGRAAAVDAVAAGAHPRHGQGRRHALRGRASGRARPGRSVRAFEGRKGARLVAVSAGDGTKLAELPLDPRPCSTA